ncbi:Protein kinase domain containing protein [Leishmania donovani]|uniref:Protein_kinase_domain_containing_protein_-_putative n=3 Tax=Leishmania donovani species complex TaxID=38574 RepID=A0A6L0XAD6_LEIIN|nr:hypothetical protein, unknown function [Leishmania infantum JPCM5]TPP41751.1 Protein kinase domain family protein [Leishmania donovani]CAC9483393.1 Protein_kinase_domain_containing_protein_-_putative [Leishmania infantum]CAJ1988251.1 Protein kinase domain containing protein [Leishmania donovani]CAM67332.1 hypothetical protein, unknown function [Leishmania infantum JPCM5]SUZ41232.1 Protein_kinase_domain_containing_protein_-_putative [Leishmania infantum]|eukprot:XP_001465089.1 hypothetical protein, unknown function [Leishmania infantum JPCM5]
MPFRAHVGQHLLRETAAMGLPELLVPPFEWPLVITALDVLESTNRASAQPPDTDVNDVAAAFEDIRDDVMEPECVAAPWEAQRHHRRAVCCLVQQLAGPQFRVLPWDPDAMQQRVVASTTPSRGPPLTLPALPPRRVFLAESTDFAGRGCVVKLLPAPALQRSHAHMGAISSATGPSTPGSPAFTQRWSPYCPVEEPAVAGEVAALLHLRTATSPRDGRDGVLGRRVLEAHPNVVTLFGVVTAEERVCCCGYAGGIETPIATAAMTHGAGLVEGVDPAAVSLCQVRAVLLENVSGGAWCDFLATYGKFLTPLCVMRWFRDVVTGLAHLHSRFIAHGNLTPANLLVRLTAAGPQGVCGGAGAAAQGYDCVKPLLEALTPSADIVEITGANGSATVRCEQMIVSALLERTQLVLSGFRCAARMSNDDGGWAAAHAAETEDDVLFGRSAADKGRRSLRTESREPRTDAVGACAAAADLWNAAFAFYLLLVGGATAVARGWGALATSDTGLGGAGTPKHLRGFVASRLPRLVSMRFPGALSTDPVQSVDGRSESACEVAQGYSGPEMVARLVSHTDASGAVLPLNAAQMGLQLRLLWTALPREFLEILDNILQGDGDAANRQTAAETARLVDQIMASPPVLQRCIVCAVPPPALLLEQWLDYLQDSWSDSFVCRPMARMPLERALQDAATRMLCLRVASGVCDAAPRWLQLASWRARLLELEGLLRQPAEVLEEWAAVSNSALLLQSALRWLSQLRAGTRQLELPRADVTILLGNSVLRALDEVTFAYEEQPDRSRGTTLGFHDAFRCFVARCVAGGQPPSPPLLEELILHVVMAVCSHLPRTFNAREGRLACKYVRG